jgi:sigma-E factor negative regulatory protein RseB
MRRWLNSSLCGLVLAAPFPVVAQVAQQDGLYWLGRVVSAVREQSYSGTFVYRNGAQTESSRITHVVDNGREYEHLEVLDGSPREVIRSNDEVKCYLPESRTLIIEKRPQHSAFPVMLPASLAGLSEYYTIRKGAVERVAGRDSQTVRLEPKDALRYGHQFWVDVESGLPLKAGMLDEHDQTLETFAFTQLTVGAVLDRQRFKSRFDSQHSGWRVLNVQSTGARGREDAWLFKSQIPGFRKLAGMKRRGHVGENDGTHVVFSDGLASMSVFIDALPENAEPGWTAMGTINVYQRVLGKHLIVVMGELPRATLKKFGDGIEPRQK